MSFAPVAYAPQRRWFLFATLLVVVALLLVGCSLSGDSGSGSQGKTSTSSVPASTAAPVALTSLHWCNNKASMVFIDSGSSTTPTPIGGKGPAQPVNLGPANGAPVAVKDWNTFKANLSFTVFLPETLPAGSCLLSAYGTVRNAIMGSNFVLTYMLPGGDALALSQAPQQTQNKTLQCGVSDTASSTGGTPTPTNTSALPLQVCSGVRDTTNITFSARWKIATLQQFFENLKSNVAWEPAA